MPVSSQPVAIFGDLEAGVWGLFLGGEQPRLAIGSLDPEAGDVQLQPADVNHQDDQTWTLAGGGNELRLEREQTTTATADGEPPLEPLRVTGAAIVAGDEREIQIAGVLAEATLNGSTESLRLVGSWFPAGHQVSLLASRPLGAKGQDRDAISVVALGEAGAAVHDPRLSTTYGPDGSPRTAAIELWVSGHEEDDEHQRRVAAVVTGASLSETVGAVSVGAYALRCASRADTGVGVYVLLRAR